MIPSWVKTGAYCVCIDENWTDDFGQEVPGPLLDDVCLITGWNIDSGEVCIRVLGWSADLTFSVWAFRPLSREEFDLLYFNTLLTGSFEPSHVLEPTCSH